LMKLKKFNQWMSVRESHADMAQTTHQMKPSGETPQAGKDARGGPDVDADLSAAMQGQDLEKLRATVHRYLEWFLQKLEGYHMPRQLAASVLAEVAKALLQNTTMTANQAKTTVVNTGRAMQ
jgi:DNA-binding protein Fis